MEGPSEGQDQGREGQEGEELVELMERMSVNNSEPEYHYLQVIQGWVQPFVKVLLNEQNDRYCANCMLPLTECSLVKCGHCKKMSYCSKECQSQDWSAAGHRVECSTELFQEELQQDLDTKSVWRVLKTLAKLKQIPGSISEKFRIYNGKFKTFLDLYEAVGVGGMDVDISESLVKQMRPLLPKELIELEMSKGDLTKIEIERACVKKLAMVWDRFGVEIRSIDELTVIGFGIYIEGSFFKHSCRPTAAMVVSEGKLQVRCILNGSDQEGNPQSAEATICLLPSFCGRKERQEVLKRKFGFTCQCVLCEMELDEDLVDYKQLKKMTTFGKKLRKKAEDYIKIWEEVTFMMTKPRVALVHCFDLRVTRLRMKILGLVMQKAESEKGDIARNELHDMWLEAGTSILHTFGNDHTYHKLYVKDYEKYHRLWVLPRVLQEMAIEMGQEVGGVAIGGPFVLVQGIITATSVTAIWRRGNNDEDSQPS